MKDFETVQQLISINSAIGYKTPIDQSVLISTNHSMIALPALKAPITVIFEIAQPNGKVEDALKCSLHQGLTNVFRTVKENILISRHGGDDAKALAKRSEIIGSYINTHNGYIDSKCFGKNLRKVIAMMSENPYQKINPKYTRILKY